MKPDELDVRAGVTEFLEHLKANGCSVHTIRSYKCDLQKFAGFGGIARRPVARVTAADLTGFLNSDTARVAVGGTALSQGAQNRLRAVLRSFFGWLHKTGQTAANAAACLRVHVYRPPMPELMTDLEYDRLLTKVDGSDDTNGQRDRVILMLLSGTGIRISEAAGLDVADVDLKGRRLSVRTKGGRSEARYLSSSLAKALRTYLKGRGEGPLFPSQRGGALGVRQMSRRLEGWLKAAGIEKRITPHTFRHTLASNLLARTGNIHLVQRALGHRSILSTLRYTQVPDTALRAALEAI